MLNYETYPNPSMVDGLRMYIENRIPPGSFITAVLCNDLREACGRADHINQRLIFETVQWLYNEFPADAWGSPKAVQAWLSAGDSDD